MNKKVFAVMACEIRILYSEKLLFASSLVILIVGILLSTTGSLVALTLSVYGIGSISMNIFAIIEKYNSERYITSFPIKRGEIVIAKYINVLLFSLVYFILAYVIGILRSIIIDQQQDYIPSSFFVIFFFCILIYVAISFPFCLRFGFGKARFLMMIVLVAPLFLQGVIIGLSSNLDSSANSAMIGNLLNTGSISLLTVVILITSGMIIFITSIPLSIFFYKSRDL